MDTRAVRRSVFFGERSGVTQKTLEELTPSIERLIRLHTATHALIWTIKVTFGYIKYSGLPFECRWRIGVLVFKTHLGNESSFWQPLFEKVGMKLRKDGIYKTDDQIWDLILPIGYRELGRIRQSLPSHAGYFPREIPEIVPKMRHRA